MDFEKYIEKDKRYAKVSPSVFDRELDRDILVNRYIEDPTTRRKVSASLKVRGFKADYSKANDKDYPRVVVYDLHDNNNKFTYYLNKEDVEFEINCSDAITLAKWFGNNSTIQ